MQVVKECDGGIVRRVVLLDDAGDDVVLVTRFLSHLSDSGYSTNTLCAYAYDLRHLVAFLGLHGLAWSGFRPSTALEFLAYLRRVPSRRPAQRLGLGLATGQGRLLSVATVARVLAATSSFFEWLIAAEEYTGTDNPMQRRVDHALGRVPDRHQPFLGAASRQQSVRRTVRVRLPFREQCLKPVDDPDREGRTFPVIESKVLKQDRRANAGREGTTHVHRSPRARSRRGPLREHRVG